MKFIESKMPKALLGKFDAYKLAQTCLEHGWSKALMALPGSFIFLRQETSLFYPLGIIFRSIWCSFNNEELCMVSIINNLLLIVWSLHSQMFSLGSCILKDDEFVLIKKIFFVVPPSPRLFSFQTEEPSESFCFHFF